MIRQQTVRVRVRNRQDIPPVFFQELPVVIVRKEKLFIPDCSIVNVVGAIEGKRD